MIRLGDVVATSSGKLYRVVHRAPDGRLHLDPLDSRGRATWARNVRLHRTYNLHQVHVCLDSAERRDRQARPSMVAHEMGWAAYHLEQAEARDEDTSAVIEGARARLNAVRAALSTLEV